MLQVGVPGKKNDSPLSIIYSQFPELKNISSKLMVFAYIYFCELPVWKDFVSIYFSEFVPFCENKLMSLMVYALMGGGGQVPHFFQGYVFS